MPLTTCLLSSLPDVRTPGDPRPATTSTPTGHALRRSLFPLSLAQSFLPPPPRRHSPHLSTPLDGGAVTAVAALAALGGGDSDKADNAFGAAEDIG